MGKHSNSRQEEMIIDFMEKYPDLARGFTKRDRTEVENLWQTLTNDLNSIGPPIKKTEAWKRHGVIRNHKSSTKQQRKENERHHKEIEKLAYEKNIIKQKLLEIQQEHLNIQYSLK